MDAVSISAEYSIDIKPIVRATILKRLIQFHFIANLSCDESRT